MTTQTVTLHLPEGVMRRAQQAAKLLQQPLEKVLADTLVSAWPDTEDTQNRSPTSSDFDNEVAAFERLKPQLQKQYAGRVVAIHHGQVVVVGSDKMNVLGEVLEKFGAVPCYIEWVTSDAPRRVRLTSAWVAR